MMHIITFVPASAASFVGEWTGRIDGDFTGDAGPYGNFKHSADLTFVVAKDGSISGEGTGWEVFERGGGYLNGRADNVTFKIRGEIVDYDTGEARLRLEEITPITYPVFDDQGTQVFVNWPFYNWETFYIELREGARVENDAFRDAGSGDTSGTDEFVITGSDLIVACPQLTITPTMPPSSDPRNLAGPTDTASYRFQVAWEGTTPAKVYFNVAGGNDSVNPNFVFNPANIQSSPISVLMDVTTDDAEQGDYPLTVDAWVIDPDTGEECHAGQPAEVVLVVSDESRASVLGLVKQSGDVTILTEEAEGGEQNVVVETGKSGLVILEAVEKVSDDTVSVAEIDVSRNAEVKVYNRVDYFAKMLEDKAKTAEELAWTDNDLLKYKHPSAWEQLKSSVQEYVKEHALATTAANANVYSCLFALDVNTIEICSGQSTIYVSNGELRLDRTSYTGVVAEVEIDRIERGLVWEKLLKALQTPNSVVITNGTEITVSVQQSPGSSITSVTVLEGSALVVDLVSEEIRLVNAGERYSMETSFAGESVSSTDKLETVSTDSVQQWWKVQIGDFATVKDNDNEFENPFFEPVNKTSVFSGYDSIVVWVKFLDVPASTSHVIDFKWYGPDGSLGLEDDYQIGTTEAYEYWPSYDTYTALGARVSEGPPREPGQYNVKVYYDGDFVKEIPFYMTQNTLIKNQSVTYTLEANVISANSEYATAVENSFALAIVSGFAEAENISGIDDIEWIKTTVLDNSAEGRIQDTLKLKGQASIDAEQRSLSDASPSAFIPTIGIDEDFTIQTGFGDPFPSELAFDSIIGVNIGGSNIEALVFSGNKKLVEGDSSADITIISYYEKDTGILVHTLISGTIVAHEIGNVKLDFVIKGTKLSIPTTLTISSISREIQQNQDVSVSGTLSPPVNEGQVVLTYKKNDATDEPIKRTVAVSNGVFSDTYKMDKDGTYSVSAEYLGSGAYLSSISDATTLTVAPSGCLIATAAFGSDLTPQVQFLRNFRDDHILSTAAGSSFMNVFNSWYYSFSPTVADYEREQPWLQTTVKAAIYPLLGILHVSENAYSLIPGEYGALSAGMIASGMIGALYLSPVALSIKQVRKSKFNYRVAILIIAAAFIAVVSAILSSNETALMITTSLFVLSIITVTAILSGKALMIIYQNLKNALRKP